MSATCPSRHYTKSQLDVITLLIQSEIKEGKIAGPFQESPFPVYVQHPVFLVPKPASPDKWRLIHDLSQPLGASLNALISAADRSVKYPTVDKAVEHILSFGSGEVFLAKSDIKHAFRNVAIRQEEHCLTVFAVDGQYYFDMRLPFGAGSSCKIFQRVSNSLVWIVTKEFADVCLIALLDDFLFIGDDFSRVATAQQRFHALCDQIRLPINHAKTIFPCRCLIYLGVTIDTVAREVRLGVDKLQKLRDVLSYAIQARRLTKLQCQRIVGLLNWAARVVRPGRAFLRTLIDLGTTLREPHHRTKVSKAVREDLSVWEVFLRDYNGVSFMRYREIPPTEKLFFSSDAAGSHGYAVLASPSWAMGRWSPEQLDWPIHVKEILPIYLGLFLWGERFRDAYLAIECDNQAVVWAINKMSARDPKLMFFVRKIVFLCLRWNIVLTALYISSHSNRAADLVSRGNHEQFLQEFPFFGREPTVVPATFLAVLEDFPG